MSFGKKKGLLGVGPYVTRIVKNSYDVNGSQIYEYIPIDYIKCKVIDFDTRRFYENSNLNFTRSINEETGEYKESFRKAVFKNLEIRIYDSGTCLLLGSIHKYYNDGMHNHDDFDSVAFQTAIDNLYHDLGIRPINLYIIGLEFGYNLLMPFEVKEILQGLVMHKKAWFETSLHGPNAYFKSVEHDRYLIKCYDKGLQFGLDYPVLRFERKETNWTKLRAMGIVTLQDFIQAPKGDFISLLVESWSEIVFYNHGPKNAPNHSRYECRSFWSDLISRGVSRNTIMKHRNRLKELNAKVHPDRQNVVREYLGSAYRNHQKGVTLSMTLPILSIHWGDIFGRVNAVA